jgi:hypothetical protein
VPQIFHTAFNTVSKVSIFGALFFVAAVAWAFGRTIRSPYATGVGLAPDQPVPFSHQHHVGGLGIDCRYCHTSVEESSFAGVPSTKICMNCHEQIWVGSSMLEPVRASYASGRPIEWVRVHRLAGFVHFDHSIHVQKGVGCVTCHGRVDQMPLTWRAATLHMEWCLECHRHPERYVRPREQVFNMAWEPTDQMDEGRRLVDSYEIHTHTSCSTCHQ